MARRPLLLLLLPLALLLVGGASASELLEQSYVLRQGPEELVSWRREDGG